MDIAVYDVSAGCGWSGAEANRDIETGREDDADGCGIVFFPALQYNQFLPHGIYYGYPGEIRSGFWDLRAGSGG